MALLPSLTNAYRECQPSVEEPRPEDFQVVGIHPHKGCSGQTTKLSAGGF